MLMRPAFLLVLLACLALSSPSHASTPVVAEAGFDAGFPMLRALANDAGSSHTEPTSTPSLTPSPTPTTTSPPPPPPTTTTAPPPTTSPAPTPTNATTAPPTTTPTPTNATTTPPLSPTPTNATNSTTKPVSMATTIATPVPTIDNTASSASLTGSVDGGKADKGGSNVTAKSSSKMSTGTIVGIVAGIVCAVGLLAFVVMGCTRRHRDSEDDPLSPFELSMDKQYQPGTYVSNLAPYNIANGDGYGHNAITNSQSNRSNDPAAAEAAGIAYGGDFYDTVTSPDDAAQMAAQQQQNAYAMETSGNSSNEWMTAMEAKHSGGDDGYTGNLPSSSGGSYDQSPILAGMDADQSSVLSDATSGHDNDVEYPEFNDSSSRGSYEL